MSLEGTIVNGGVVFDEAPALPDGTRVVVQVRPPAAPTLRGLLKFAGCIPDMPADFAAEHDHYSHGAPRRAPEAYKAGGR